MVNRLFCKLKQFFQGKVGFGDIFIDCYSHLVNYFELQRKLRRRLFPLNKIVCGLISANDLQKYIRFICRYSTQGRRNAVGHLKDQQFNRNPKELHFVAQYLQEIIASVSLTGQFSMNGIEFWELSSLMVLGHFQGYGIATKLMHTAIESVRNKKIAIYLSVDSENYRAIKLYEKFNFQEDQGLLDQCLKVKNIHREKNRVLFYKNQEK